MAVIDNYNCCDIHTHKHTDGLSLGAKSVKIILSIILMCLRYSFLFNYVADCCRIELVLNLPKQVFPLQLQAESNKISVKTGRTRREIPLIFKIICTTCNFSTQLFSNKVEFIILILEGVGPIDIRPSTN